MSSLTNSNSGKEHYKAIIDFGSGTEYVAYSVPADNDESDGSFIENVSVNDILGNTDINPIGVQVSNEASLEIYDVLNKLSPSNTNSPYYGLMTSDVKVRLFIAEDRINNIPNWKPYGVFYTTEWYGGFSAGSHDVAIIQCESILNRLLDNNMPSISVSANVELGELVSSVFIALGLSASDFDVSVLSDMNMKYGVMSTDSVRDFINTICSISFTRINVGRDGVIRFEKPNEFYLWNNELTINNSLCISSMSDYNNQGTDYGKLIVKYYSDKTRKKGLVFSGSRELHVGANSLSDIVFTEKVIAISNIVFNYNKTEYDALVTDSEYEYYQNGMQIDFVVTGTSIDDCEISVYGTYASGEMKSVQAELSSYSSSSKEFTYETEILMTKEEAEAILDKFILSLEMNKRLYTLSESDITPMLHIGDKLIIESTNTIYDGEYKVVETNVNAKQFSNTVKLVRLGGE